VYFCYDSSRIISSVHSHLTLLSFTYHQSKTSLIVRHSFRRHLCGWRVWCVQQDLRRWDMIFIICSKRILVTSEWGGRAIAQAVSGRLPTAAAQVRARVRSCGIYGGQSGTGAGFLRVLPFPLPIRILPFAPQSSSIIWGWYNRPNSDRSTKWTHSHLTRKKNFKMTTQWPTPLSDGDACLSFYLFRGQFWLRDKKMSAEFLDINNILSIRNVLFYFKREVPYLERSLKFLLYIVILKYCRGFRL
jgi:hypothetical protein